MQSGRKRFRATAHRGPQASELWYPRTNYPSLKPIRSRRVRGRHNGDAVQPMPKYEHEKSERVQQTRDDEARKVIEEYASSLREFIERLRKHWN